MTSLRLESRMGLGGNRRNSSRGVSTTSRVSLTNSMFMPAGQIEMLKSVCQMAFKPNLSLLKFKHMNILSNFMAWN